MEGITTSDLLGWTATCMTILFFSNGYMEIQKMNNPEEFALLPYASMFLQSLAWLLYGTINPLGPNSSMILTNAVGLLLASYFLVFLYKKFGPYIPSLLSNIVWTLAAGTVILFWAMLLPLGPYTSHTALGRFATVLTLFCFGAPLSQLKGIIASKNTLGISPSFVLMSTLVTLLWTAYGFSIEDPNVIIPNTAGLVLCLIQWALLAILGTPRPLKQLPGP